MNLLLIFSTGFALGISGAMIPGPLTFYTVSEVIKTNKFAGLRIILGHVLLELALIMVIFKGFSSFLTNKTFLSVVSIIGSIALVVMGVILLIYSKEMKLSDVKKGKVNGNKGLILGGIFFSIISPGFLIWWATIGFSSALRSLSLGVWGLVAIMLGHWTADVSWYGLLSIMVEKGKMLLSDFSYQKLIRFFSCVLIVLGVLFAAMNRY